MLLSSNQNLVKLLLLISYWFILCSNSVFAQENESISQRHFSVAVGADSYPYQFADDQGNADGLMIDIWKLWAQRNGYTIEFKSSAWQQSLLNLEQGAVDFHAGMAISEPRLERYLMGRPQVALQAGLFVHKQVVDVNSLADLEPYVIGVVEGSMHVNALKRLIPQIFFKHYATRDHLYRAALKGEVKVFVGMDRLSTRHRGFERLSQLFPLYKKVNYESFYLTHAVTRERLGLNQLIEDGLLNIKVKEIHQLERKWLGVGAESDALVIAMPIDKAPFMSTSAQGEPIGLIVDLWKKWEEKTQRKVVFIAEDQATAMRNLMDKRADIYAAYADTSVNTNLLPHAHHIYSYQSKIYFPMTEHHQPLTEKQLHTAVIGVLEGDPVIEKLKVRFPQAQLVMLANLELIVEQAMAEDIDGFVAPVEVMKVHLIKTNQQTQFANIDNVSFEDKMYSLVRQDNQALISQIKEGFSLIENDELQAIERAWVSSAEAQFFSRNKTKVVFNQRQKNWLLRHPVIRLGALKDWAPIEFVDDNGKLIGVTADLITIIQKRAQISIEVQIYDKWSELITGLKQGQIDMVASMDKTEAREEFATFTDEYWPHHWAIVTPSRPVPVSRVADLKGKRLAVVKGYQLIPKLHQDFPETLLQIVPDSESGFIALRQGQADAFIDGMATIASEIRANDHRDLTFSLVEDIPPAMERIGIRKDWQPLVGIINKVLKTITDDEKKDILETWFELKVHSGIDKTKVLQAATLAALIIIVILWWNRRLQREIKLRLEIEEKIKHIATHDELTQLPNRALLRDRLDTAIAAHSRHQEQLALLFIDLDGFKEVNDTHGHDIGDELLVQLGARFKTMVRKTDTVARFGGDEFVVLLTSLNHRKQAGSVCELLLQTIAKPFYLSNCVAKVGASVGIAMYPEDGTDATQLMKVADTLMYQVKASGKNGYFFSGKKDTETQTS